jgi:MOSC domain-containing protein YiiM
METKAIVDIVTGKGISGDASYGRKKKQILIASTSLLSQLRLHPGDLRENIVVGDLNVDMLPTEADSSIGNTRLVITGPCEPCPRMDEIRPGLQAKFKGRRGVLARALSNSQIFVGDPV